MALRILVADDSEDMRLLLRMVLDGHGFTVVVAADGDEALKSWHDEKDDLFAVVLDHRMPGHTGLEVASEILRERPEQRVILFSAQLDPGLAARATDLGVRACIGKEEVAHLASHPALQAD